MFVVVWLCVCGKTRLEERVDGWRGVASVALGLVEVSPMRYSLVWFGLEVRRRMGKSIAAMRGLSTVGGGGWGE